MIARAEARICGVEGAAPVYAPLLWRDAVAVIAGERFVAGIDLRTGKRLWTQDGLRPKGQPWAGDGDALFVPGDGIAALEPRTGRVQWRSKDFRQGAPTSFAGGSPRKGSLAAASQALYDSIDG